MMKKSIGILGCILGIIATLLWSREGWGFVLRHWQFVLPILFFIGLRCRWLFLQNERQIDLIQQKIVDVFQESSKPMSFVQLVDLFDDQTGHDQIKLTLDMLVEDGLIRLSNYGDDLPTRYAWAR